MTQVKTYPEGVPSWIDIEQADVESAQSFYGGVFGWTFHEVTTPRAMVRTFVAQLQGRDAAGLSGPSARGGLATWSPEWNTSVAVEDLDAAIRRAVAAGGRIDADSEEFGVGGRSAAVTDPSGIRFRLWQVGERPGAQAVNVPGAWNFSDLHTNDPNGAKDFYRAVFGWVFDDLGYATLIRQPGYGDHLESTIDPGIRERQSGVAAPPGFEDAIGWLASADPGDRPHWHVTFTVADRDESATRAERLGGTVVASVDTDWTREVVIRDPQGAVFTASQFSPVSG